MNDSRRNRYTGITCILLLVLLFTAVVQSSVSAMNLFQHSHSRSICDETSAAPTGGESVDQYCEQHCLSAFCLTADDPRTEQPRSPLLVNFDAEVLKRRAAEAISRPPKTVS
jgi:hypothetical protein